MAGDAAGQAAPEVQPPPSSENGTEKGHVTKGDGHREEAKKPHFSGKDIFLLEDGRTYHLGVKAGEIHPRILTVGCPRRAEMLKTLLDKDCPVKSLVSSRAFHVHSGTFRGTPVSIVAIGMGAPMMDFLIREASFVLQSPMAVVRLGTCGLLQPHFLPGDLVVAGKGSVYVYKDYALSDGVLNEKDGEESLKEGAVATAASPDESEEEKGRRGAEPMEGGDTKKRKVHGAGEEGGEEGSPKSSEYVITKPVPASETLSKLLFSALKRELDKEEENEGGSPSSPATTTTSDEATTGARNGGGGGEEKKRDSAVHWGLNASGETFYSCQGRKLSGFSDHSPDLINRLQAAGVGCMEMESHQLFHLARARTGFPTYATACAVGLVSRVNELIKDAVAEDLMQRRMEVGGTCCLEALTRLPLDGGEKKADEAV